MHLVLWKLMSHIFFLLQVVLSQGINYNGINEEFCHGEAKVIKTTVLKCDVKEIRVTVQNDSNLIEHCVWIPSGVWCNYGTFNKARQSLEFTFTFYHGKHSGKKLWVNSTCRDGSTSNRLINLIPCLSEFTVTATHNNTHAFLNCKHRFFDLSKGIHIKLKKSRHFVLSCKWNKIKSAAQCQSKEQGHIHKNGIDGFITDYPKEYQCTMDGQTIDFEPEKVSSTPVGDHSSDKVSGQRSISMVKSIGNNTTDTINGCTSHSLKEIVLVLSLIVAYNEKDFIESGFVFLPS